MNFIKDLANSAGFDEFYWESELFCGSSLFCSSDSCTTPFDFGSLFRIASERPIMPGLFCFAARVRFKSMKKVSNTFIITC